MSWKVANIRLELDEPEQVLPEKLADRLGIGLDGIASRVFGFGSGADLRGRAPRRLARAIQRRLATRAGGTLGLTGPVAPQAEPLVHGMQGRESER